MILEQARMELDVGLTGAAPADAHIKHRGIQADGLIRRNRDHPLQVLAFGLSDGVRDRSLISESGAG